jgi:3-deoxy-manno-octulosonate cytidylyltransferase (CMP-KDO synthetase)
VYENAMAQPLVLIPARMGSSRLPGKPLADIAGAPMIVHVWRRACAAGVGPVHVATDGPDIAEVIRAAGGSAILTRADHLSGSDRIAEAAALIDPDGACDVIINVQGDEPLIDPAAICAARALMSDAAVDLGTLAAPLTDDADRADPACVKMIATRIGPARLRAHYFTRAPAPYGAGEDFRHIGLYAWRRSALARFVQLAPSPLELREKLEQLRALEDFMRIDAALVEGAARGVDTPHDLARVRAALAQQQD